MTGVEPCPECGGVSYHARNCMTDKLLALEEQCADLREDIARGSRRFPHYAARLVESMREVDTKLTVAIATDERLERKSR